MSARLGLTTLEMGRTRKRGPTGRERGYGGARTCSANGERHPAALTRAAVDVAGTGGMSMMPQEAGPSRHVQTSVAAPGRPAAALMSYVSRGSQR
jgi:hypothetical protein